MKNTSLRRWIYFTVFWAGAAGVAAAQPANLPVVELFTSQGCSSCPPADKLMGTLAQRRDVLALSYPVDIWDYLGWKDTLANPKFTLRQRTYATTRGDGNVYTPQAIVNGRLHVVGSDQTAIEGALAQTRSTLAAEAVSLSATADRGVLKVEAGAATNASAAKGTVWLVTVRPRIDVDVKGGENGGHHLVYYNVVRDMTAVGMWSGKPLSIELPAGDVLKPDETCALLLQAGKGGPILAATWLDTK
jgi:hypothetical protein